VNIRIFGSLAEKEIASNQESGGKNTQGSNQSHNPLLYCLMNKEVVGVVWHYGKISPA
jgi:hypothetical protein